MLLSSFINNIRKQQLFQKGDLLLLAVSGGVDSVVLCELCHEAKFRFEIAHSNFQLRGKESNDDESFVKRLAEKYDVPFHTIRFDTLEYAEQKKVSVQVAARELRYQWFAQIIQQRNALLVTAHHADDNIETVLMNFFRGTGIHGLRGMRSKNNTIVRPLLPFTKSEIVSFAKEKKLKWHEDSSNASDKYSRNFFRNAIIPAISKVYPQAEHNITENIRRFADTEKLYEQAIAVHKKNLLEKKANEWHIPVLKLLKSEPLHTIVYEIIREFDFSTGQVSDVIHLLEAEQGKYVQSSSHRIFRNRNWLIISPAESVMASNHMITEDQPSIDIHEGRLCFKVKDSQHVILAASPGTALFDMREISFPLILRKWKAGDYFYPLGMRKKKKISRFLIDQKLSPTEKEKVMVLESRKRICWVVGLRSDDRFRVTEQTKKVLVADYERR
jgi:tRNA(Ile)-lysidine synthase